MDLAIVFIRSPISPIPKKMSPVEISETVATSGTRFHTILPITPVNSPEKRSSAASEPNTWRGRKYMVVRSTKEKNAIVS